MPRLESPIIKNLSINFDGIFPQPQQQPQPEQQLQQPDLQRYNLIRPANIEALKEQTQEQNSISKQSNS